MRITSIIAAVAITLARTSHAAPISVSDKDMEPIGNDGSRTILHTTNLPEPLVVVPDSVLGGIPSSGATQNESEDGTREVKIAKALGVFDRTLEQALEQMLKQINNPKHRKQVKVAFKLFELFNDFVLDKFQKEVLEKVKDPKTKIQLEGVFKIVIGNNSTTILDIVRDPVWALIIKSKPDDDAPLDPSGKQMCRLWNPTSGPVWAPCPTEVTNPNNDPTEFLQPEFCGEGRLCPAPEDKDGNPDLEKVQNTDEPDKVEDVDGGEKAVEEKNHDSGN